MHVLSAIGLMFILKYGTIFNNPRRFLCKCIFFKELFECAMCLGFWCGIAIAVVAKYATVEVILFGLMTSFLCLVADLGVEIWDEVKCFIWNKNKDKMRNQDDRGKDEMGEGQV